MDGLLAQTNFFADPNGSGALWIKLFIGLLLGFGLLFGLLQIPTHARRYVVAIVTFLSGLFFVLSFLWPKPIKFDSKAYVPLNAVENVGSLLNDASGVVVNFTQILSGFLLGLGIFSLLRIHLTRIGKGHKDSGFSIVLLVSMVTMAVVGMIHKHAEFKQGAVLDRFENQTVVNKLMDILFEGLLQQMDAIMFSLIAFFILSAAYRAFRIRSIEATILLAVALLMILSLMGLVVQNIDGFVDRNNLSSNFKLGSISTFLRKSFQTPSINAIGFGTGLGALAMGIRIWLSLDKRGGK